MNRDSFTTVLAVVLLVSVIATAGMCYWYLQSARQLRTAQLQMLAVNRNRALMQQFAGEAVEYGRSRNPALIPILEGVGIRARTEDPSAQPNSLQP